MPIFRNFNNLLYSKNLPFSCVILFPIKKMDSVFFDSIKENFLHINSSFNKFILKKAEQINKIRDDAIKTKQDKENMANKIFSALNEIDASDNNF